MRGPIDHRQISARRHDPSRWECFRRASHAAGHALSRLALALLAAAAVPALAQELQLDEEEAVRRALAASHVLEASRHRGARAAAGVAAADADRLPALSAGAGAAYRSSVPEFAAPIAGPGQPSVVLFPDIRTTAAVSLEVSQSLYTGGALSARREAARRELDAAAAATAAAHLDLRLAARAAYWRTAAAEAGVAVAESHVRRTLKLSEDVRSQRGAGLAVDADVLAAEARLAAARLALLRAGRAADETLATLRVLLDLPRGTAVRLADAAPPPLPSPPADLDGLAAAARQQRPELGALRARATALAARAEAARAAVRPAVGASAVWELARPNPRFLPLEDAWHDSWSVGLAGRWTFWDGGRAAAEVGSLEAERRAVNAELAELERRVALEVEHARLALQAELAAAGAAEASRAAAAERLRAVGDRHAAGLAVTAEVLDAQADLAAAEGERILAATGTRLAAAQLDRAVGR